MLDDLTRGKLAIARQLLARATAAAAEPGILGPAVGVSLSQDALELLLVAAAEHHRASITAKSSFDDLLSELAKVGHSVPQASRLQRINKARVGFKHHGIVPDSQIAKTLVSHASLAADEICTQLLGESIWTVSATQLVFRTRVRNHLDQAKHLKDEGDFRGSVAASARAFALTFGDDLGADTGRSRNSGYRRRLADSISTGSIHSSSSPREIVSGIQRLVGSLAGAADQDLENIHRTLNGIQDDLMSIALGVDLAYLNRYRSIAPRVSISQARTLRVAWGRSYESISIEDSEFVFDFAFDAIVRAQRPLPTQEITAGVIVIKDTPIVVWPSKEPEQLETIRVARQGERFATPPRSRPQDGHTLIVFEEDPAYVAAEDVAPLGSAIHGLD